MPIVGSSFSYQFVIQNTSEVDVDVSTWTFEVEWYDDANGKKILDLTDGVDFVGTGTDGECKLVLTAAQATQLEPGIRKAVAWRTDGTNELVIGEFMVPFKGLANDVAGDTAVRITSSSSSYKLKPI